MSQITATPAFSTPHVLAQFASKAYTDCKTGETDAQYETRLVLPDGRRILTTASNSKSKEGYSGGAYWHPQHQKVVKAHRATNLTNLGAYFTDVYQTLFKIYLERVLRNWKRKCQPMGIPIQNTNSVLQMTRYY